MQVTILCVCVAIAITENEARNVGGNRARKDMEELEGRNGRREMIVIFNFKKKSQKFKKLIKHKYLLLQFHNSYSLKIYLKYYTT